MKSHVNELGDCSGELSCRLIPTRGGQESILLCVMFRQDAQVFKNVFIEVGILWTNLFFAMGWEEGSFTFSWGLSVAQNGRKWIQKDLSLRSMAVFSGALQFYREHDWAPSRKNARERGAISSRFLCPSLPADFLWVSFVTHSFLLCGEATSALAPRLYLPHKSFLYMEQSTANSNSFKVAQKTAFEAKGQLYTTGKVIQRLFIIDLYT